MKKLLSMFAVVLTLGLGSMAMEAEAAKRVGSGKSVGQQRTTADKAPAAAPSAAPGAAGAAAAAPKRSWMGPLAGLAAGLGLAALASHLGFGEEMANMMMIALAVMVVIGVIGFVMRKRAGGGMQPAAAGAGAFGGNANLPSDQQPAAAYKQALPAAGGSMIGSAIGSSAGGAPQAASAIPADFDVAGFERNAKTNFIRLQAANDVGNLDEIRQITTPEMFAEIKLDLAERGAAVQKSDVVSIHSQVIEVVEEGNDYRVSVRFTGFIKDGVAKEDESFDEIWHLTKGRTGNGGWLLAGIQQSA